MEGYLHKWTNYLKGWQLRYFVLKDGILSYYNTENDSKNGDCKRSYKIFMFDIMVNKSDKTRVDLILPNEHNLYLRASDYKERQTWLVALASQKAIYPSNSIPNSSTETNDLIIKQSNEPKMTGTYDSTYYLKLKQSELKLYCDLLTQQTHDLKNVVVDIRKNVPKTESDQKAGYTNNLLKPTSDNVSTISSSYKSTITEIDAKNSDSDFESNSCEKNENPNDDNNDIKKLDEMSSNINVTCDMLVQIVRNLLVLSNTSSNISPEAVKSLLNETESNKNKDQADISIELDQYKYHLYHPLYLNQQLNQYKTNKNFTSYQPNTSQNSMPDKQSNNREKMKQTESSSLSSSPKSTRSLPTKFKSAELVTYQAKYKNNNDIKHKISSNNHNHVDLNKFSVISNNFLIRNYHIENLKETALLASADPVAEQFSHNLFQTESNSINKVESQENEIMIESSTSETLIVTSGPFPAITIVGESHKTHHEIKKSFFSIIKHRFSEINLLDNNGIPTEYFLNCCSDVFSLLDSFGSTAFLPVKIDVYGNINKIKQKYSLDPVKYKTLQAIVQHEIDNKQTHAKNSATDALMWLRRAVWFLREFLSNFSKSVDSVMSECVHMSYQKTLKQYHNFVVRSIFSLAMRSLPSKEEFYKRLVADHSVYLDNKHQFEQQIIEEMKVTVRGIDRIIDIIKDFYQKNKLDV